MGGAGGEGEGGGGGGAGVGGGGCHPMTGLAWKDKSNFRSELDELEKELIFLLKNIFFLF